MLTSYVQASLLEFWVAMFEVLGGKPPSWEPLLEASAPRTQGTGVIQIELRLFCLTNFVEVE